MTDVSLTPTEMARRDALRLSKPLAYKKVLRYPEMLAAGRSIAQMQVQARTACNMLCTHCFATALKEDGPELSIKEIRYLAEQADDMGLAQITLTGGEPLLWQDLPAILWALMPDRFTIALDTNGWWLGEKARWLKTVGVDKVQVSLDSSDEATHDAFRNKPGSWHRAVEGIREARRVGLRVIASTCITDERVVSDEFDGFVTWMNSAGVDVFANPVRPTGEWKQTGLATQFCLDRVTDMQVEGRGIFQHSTPQGYGMDEGRGGTGCIAVQRQFYVTATGNVHPCPTIPLTLGNIRSEPLETIITRGLDMGYRDRVQGCPGMYCMTGLEPNYEEIRLGEK
jgi:MoaA/NifB/PqqE/SkfB family radical SAM enzyme